MEWRCSRVASTVRVIHKALFTFKSFPSFKRTDSSSVRSYIEDENVNEDKFLLCLCSHTEQSIPSGVSWSHRQTHWGTDITRVGGNARRGSYFEVSRNSPSGRNTVGVSLAVLRRWRRLQQCLVPRCLTIASGRWRLCRHPRGPSKCRRHPQRNFRMVVSKFFVDWSMARGRVETIGCEDFFFIENVCGVQSYTSDTMKYFNISSIRRRQVSSCVRKMVYFVVFGRIHQDQKGRIAHLIGWFGAAMHDNAKMLIWHNSL